MGYGAAQAGTPGTIHEASAAESVSQQAAGGVPGSTLGPGSQVIGTYIENQVVQSLLCPRHDPWWGKSSKNLQSLALVCSGGYETSLWIQMRCLISSASPGPTRARILRE